MGAVEILVVAGAIFLVFGGKKLKEFARGLGESTKELKKVKREYTEAVSDTPLEGKS